MIQPSFVSDGFLNIMFCEQKKAWALRKAKEFSQLIE